MWVDLLKWAGEAAVAYFAADTVSRLATDKGLHEHVFAWWNNMRDTIMAWCNRNASLGITRLVASTLGVIDDAAVKAKRLINFVVKADTQQRGAVEITQNVVPADEVARLFPEIVGRNSITIPS